MKKFLSVLMALTLLFGLAVPTTAAAEESTIIWVDKTDENGNLVENVDMVATENLYDPFQTNRLYEGHGCQGIKPSDMAAPAKVTFSVDVETAGKYQISILYAAKTGDALRKVDVYVNDVLTNNCTVEMQADWETVAEHKILVDLKAGENDVTLTSSADYDGSTVKNINVYGIKYTLKQAAAPVAETTTIWVDTTDENGNLVENVDLVATENLYDPFQTNRLYEGHGCQGIKPSDMAAPAKVTFSVDVETAGKYQISVLYAAKTGSAVRKFDVYVNDTLTHNCTVEMQADWETVAEHKILVDLKAGENDVTLTSSADYDSDTVKNINVYGIKYTLKEAAPALPTTPEEILKAAYALDKNASLEGTYTLTGVITSVDTAYNSQFKNISVTMAVDGFADMPILAFRLGKGEATTLDDVAALAIGDTITVTGTIKNYNGTVEFDAKCTLDAVVKGEAPVIEMPTTVEGILEAAFALDKGAALPEACTLTGEITSIKTAFDAKYNNVSVIIKVLDKELLCYRLKGEGADTIAVGDTITVTGTIKNYNGTIEFDTGCTLDAVVKAEVAPQLGYLGRANSYAWQDDYMGHTTAVFTFASADETLTPDAIVGQAAGFFGWWHAYVLEYNEANGTFVVTVADPASDGVNTVETATLGYGKLVVMLHDGFADTDAATYNYFLEKATVGTEFYLVGDYDTIVATWDVLADTYLTTEKPEKYWTKPVVTPDEPIVVEGDEYVIKKGDTLSKIAKACGLTVKELVEANKIENPDVIRKGATLIIPKVEVKRHIVVKGDSLSKIAKTYGCKVADLVKLNNIENPDLIVRGDIIVLP